MQTGNRGCEADAPEDPGSKSICFNGQRRSDGSRTAAETLPPNGFLPHRMQFRSGLRHQASSLVSQFSRQTSSREKVQPIHIRVLSRVEIS